MAQLSTWLIGPAKGLGVAAIQGDLPQVWRSHNKHGSPVAVLLIQGVIGSIFSLAFLRALGELGLLDPLGDDRPR